MESERSLSISVDLSVDKHCVAGKGRQCSFHFRCKSHRFSQLATGNVYVNFAFDIHWLLLTSEYGIAKLQERGFSSHGAYSLSKLCNIMFSMELAGRLEGRGMSITSNALDPGTVNTKMLLAGWGPIGIPVQQANDVFQLATNDNFANVTGQYFVSLRQSNPPAPAQDVAARHRLWDILQSQTGAEWKW